MIKLKDLEPIGATAAKTNFGDILHQVSVNDKKYLVNRQGKPVAVVLSFKEFCKITDQLKTK